jgi:hypothetical protein
MGLKFRKEVVNRSLNYPDEILPDDMLPEEVVAMYNPSTYGGQLQIYVASETLKRQIHVYNINRPGDPPMVYGGDHASWPIIRIVYVNNIHYDLVLDVTPQKTRNAVSNAFDIALPKKNVKFNTVKQVKIIPNNEQKAQADAEAAAVGRAAAAAQRKRNTQARRQREATAAEAATQRNRNTQARWQREATAAEAATQRNRNTQARRQREATAKIKKRSSNGSMNVGLPFLTMAASTVACTVASFIATLA